MLAKSRSDYIARRAALSAPSKFLPRLLLCSGLSQTSLLTMIERLGKLGESASKEKNKVYRDLLTPSATSDWGFGHLGTRRDVARKLIGRLSAYMNLYELSADKLAEGASKTFIEWLHAECQPLDKPRKPKHKRYKAEKTVSFSLVEATDILASVASNDEMVVDNKVESDASSMDSFVESQQMDGPKGGSLADDEMKKFVQKCVKVRRFDSLEEWLEENYMDQGPMAQNDDASPATEDKSLHLCVLLIDQNFSLKDELDSWDRILQLWIPYLSRRKGSPELWSRIFALRWEDAPGDLLLMRCMSVWSESHVLSCQDWILSSNYFQDEELDVDRMVQFLATTSSQRTAHQEAFERVVTNSGAGWMDNKNRVEDACKLVLECVGNDDESATQRNMLPSWLQLILIVARRGKNQTNLLISKLLVAIPEFDDEKEIQMALSTAILRLYAYFPEFVNLGNENVRSVLVEAAKSADWLDWRSPRDGQIDDMLVTLTMNPVQRITQGLVEISKSHPLLLVRKLKQMAVVLEHDASSAHNPRNSNNRARVHGENIDGPVTAKYDGKLVRVTVRHWGYSFTDALWVSVVEIMLSIPREVLFPCGLGAGLEELLAVYLKLLFMQSQLNNRDRASRVRARFSDLLTVFESTDSWTDWLSSKMPELASLGTVRNILISCNLMSPAKGFENLREAHSRGIRQKK